MWHLIYSAGSARKVDTAKRYRDHRFALRSFSGLSPSPRSAIVRQKIYQGDATGANTAEVEMLERWRRLPRPAAPAYHAHYSHTRVRMCTLVLLRGSGSRLTPASLWNKCVKLATRIARLAAWTLAECSSEQRAVAGSLVRFVLFLCRAGATLAQPIVQHKTSLDRSSAT